MPAHAPDIPVYAGDTCSFNSYTFKEGNQAIDLVAAGWTGWAAQWRPSTDSSTVIDLVVDTTAAASGTISVSATSIHTRIMERGGVWDLQATRGEEVKTWVVGSTSYTKDVTRIV